MRARRWFRGSPVTTARVQSLCLLTLLIAAALLRVYQLDGSSLWSDEGNTWAQLDRSFAGIAQAAAADIHPPGYYWLLKVWSAVAGSDATGMRSFSAAAGILLVYVVYEIALLVSAAPQRTPTHAAGALNWYALLAALLAALNPFQVYYSQEARMYMLLALESAGLMWATLRIIDPPASPPGSIRLPALLVYLLCGVAGLWTHYSFPIVLAAVVCAYLVAWLRSTQRAASNLLRFATVNLVVFLLFAPWLPTALIRIQAWPKGGVDTPWPAALLATLQTLLIGPLLTTPAPFWPWLLAAALLPLLGLWALRWRQSALALALWLLAPIGLMLSLGLYSAAFLKFLLIASPAWCLATAASPLLLRNIWSSSVGAQLLIALGAIVLAAWTLPAYYRNPTARDNYAGVARYIAAVGDPVHDLVILDAPGQQEVWRYYDPGLPVLALPAQRPADAEKTIATLAAAVADRRQLFALYWATDEADPNLVVERWLGENAFKGVESWQGNLRFVTYSRGAELGCAAQSPPLAFGDQITLTATCRSAAQQSITPGEVLLVGLHWLALEPIEQRYKVTVQLLDARGQIVAQHDGEPAGGAAPTATWTPGRAVADQHGLFIPFGTPPGQYHLIVALYDPISGVRLSTATGASVALGGVEVTRGNHPVALDILPIQEWVRQILGPVKLLGYDLYRQGYGHSPETPVPVGEPVTITLWWQMPDPAPRAWPADLTFTLQLGAQQLTAPLAGGNYPTEKWRPGEIVRATFALPYDGASQPPRLTVAGDTLRLNRVLAE